MKRLIAAFAIAVLMAAACFAQSASKKSFKFHGKVEAVSSDGLTVNGDKIDGWMDAMTMKYKVDDPKVLKRVREGGVITVTVYGGDYSLHNVKVSGNAAK